MIRILPILCFLLHSETSAIAADALKIESDHLDFATDGSVYHAYGNVYVQLPKLKLYTSSIRMNPPHNTLYIDAPFHLTWNRMILSGSSAFLDFGVPRMIIHAPSARLPLSGAPIQLRAERLTCTRSTCTATNAQMDLCPSCPGRVALKSRQTTVSEDGDITLRRAVLRIAGIPLVPIAALRLRPPSKVGLLVPQMEWQHRYGAVVGTGLHLPLSTDHSVQLRSAILSRGGTRSSLMIRHPHTSMAFHHLFFEADHSLAIKGPVVVTVGPVDTRMDIFLLNNPIVLDSLPGSTRIHAITHTHSRTTAAIGGPHHRIVAYGELIQDLSHASVFTFAPRIANTGLLATAISPSHRLPVIWRGTLSLTHQHDAIDHSDDTRLRLLPSLSLPLTLNAVKLETHTGLDMSSSFRSRHPPSTPQLHLTGVSIATLPLIHTTNRFRHLLSPGIAHHYHTPLFSTADSLTPPDPSKGQDMIFFAKNRFGKEFIRRRLLVNLRHRIHLPGTGTPIHLAEFQLDATPSTLPLFLRGNFNWNRMSVSSLMSGLSTPPSAVFRMHASAAYFSDQYIRPLPASTFVHADTTRHVNVELPVHRLILINSFHVSPRDFLHAGASVQLQTIPVTRIHSLHYYLDVFSGCNCFKIQLLAKHRTLDKFPDILLTISRAP